MVQPSKPWKWTRASQLLVAVFVLVTVVVQVTYGWQALSDSFNAWIGTTN